MNQDPKAQYKLTLSMFKDGAISMDDAIRLIEFTSEIEAINASTQTLADASVQIRRAMNPDGFVSAGAVHEILKSGLRKSMDAASSNVERARKFVAELQNSSGVEES